MVDFEFSTVFARWKHFATLCEHENEKLVSMALQKGDARSVVLPFCRINGFGFIRALWVNIMSKTLIKHLNMKNFI